MHGELITVNPLKQNPLPPRPDYLSTKILRDCPLKPLSNIRGRGENARCVLDACNVCGKRTIKKDREARSFLLAQGKEQPLTLGVLQAELRHQLRQPRSLFFKRMGRMRGGTDQRGILLSGGIQLPYRAGNLLDAATLLI